MKHIVDKQNRKDIEKHVGVLVLESSGYVYRDPAKDQYSLVVEISINKKKTNLRNIFIIILKR